MKNLFDSTFIPIILHNRKRELVDTCSTYAYLLLYCQKTGFIPFKSDFISQEQIDIARKLAESDIDTKDIL